MKTSSRRWGGRAVGGAAPPREAAAPPTLAPRMSPSCYGNPRAPRPRLTGRAACASVCGTSQASGHPVPRHPVPRHPVQSTVFHKGHILSLQEKRSNGASGEKRALAGAEALLGGPARGGTGAPGPRQPCVEPPTGHFQGLGVAWAFCCCRLFSLFPLTR